MNPIPRLYIAFFTNAEPAIKRLEMQGVKNLGFTGVRLGYSPSDTIGNDNLSPFNPYSKARFLGDVELVKELGMKVHLGLATGYKPSASVEVNFAVDKEMMARYSSVLGPDDLSFHLTNEPKEFHDSDQALRTLDTGEKVSFSLWRLLVKQELLERWKRVLDHYEAVYKPKGYKMYGPTFEGFMEFRSPGTYTGLYEWARYLDMICDTPDYRYPMYRTGQNFNLYVVNTADAAERSYQKTMLGLDRLGRYEKMRNGFAITEFNVRADPNVSGYSTGFRQAKAVRRLLSIPDLDFVTVYSANQHQGYAFFYNGVPDSRRVSGWKAGIK